MLYFQLHWLIWIRGNLLFNFLEREQLPQILFLRDPIKNEPDKFKMQNVHILVHLQEND